MDAWILRIKRRIRKNNAERHDVNESLSDVIENENEVLNELNEGNNDKQDNDVEVEEATNRTTNS